MTNAEAADNLKRIRKIGWFGIDRKEVIDLAIKALENAPTLSPDDVRGGGCAYCKEDRDGYTMPLEKNAHAWVQYPNKLVIQFGKEIRKCEIKYCPMCGARMKGAKDGTTDNS